MDYIKFVNSVINLTLEKLKFNIIYSIIIIFFKILNIFFLFQVIIQIKE